MEQYITLIIFSAAYLLILNFFLIKFNISLDKENKNENHKSLLRKNKHTPLSGTFYFLPIILFLFYDQELIVVVFCSLFFFLGLFSDLKILDSYRLRLIFQFLFFVSLFFINKDIIINTRIEFIDNLMNYTAARILICTFFFMVLINGFNLIDGTNCLCSLNFLIILIFIYLLCKKLNIQNIDRELIILTIFLSVFLLFNFLGKNFLGDGAAYGVGFFLGYLLLKISLISDVVSPFFIANLLWFPAFENLFSIIRRNISNKNKYLPDNGHLHQLIYKYLKKKKLIKKNFLLSSLVGIIINTTLLTNFSIGYFNLSNSIIQIILITIGVILYLISYYYFFKKLN